MYNININFSKFFILLNDEKYFVFLQVHKVLKREDNKVYAIKELVHFIQNKSDEKQKRREVYINEILGHHPNIVRLICAWRENCVLYMQFEWCPYSLHDILKTQHEIEAPDIYYFLIDILKVLTINYFQY